MIGKGQFAASKQLKCVPPLATPWHNAAVRMKSGDGGEVGEVFLTKNKYARQLKVGTAAAH
jgi:hypothetical protein